MPRLLLHGDSELTFDKLSAYGATGMTDTRMRLPKGRTSSEVKPLRGAGSHFIIETPDLMSSVRGTRFRVGSDGGDSQIEVTEGRVQVDGAGRKLLLQPNQGTVNGTDGAPAPEKRAAPGAGICRTGRNATAHAPALGGSARRATLSGAGRRERRIPPPAA